MNAALPLALLGAMLALMALRVPIWAAMFVPGAVGYLLLAGDEALRGFMKGLVFARFSVYDLTVVPLFILMGQFAAASGLSAALFRAAAAFVAHRRGGLAQAAIVACAAFGAVCGSSVATAATIAQVALPEMRRYRYEPGFATATLAAGGTLGILIPPSVVLVVYAILAQQNIAKLFAAAFVPGLIAAAGYCVAIALFVRQRPQAGPPEPRLPWRARWAALRAVWPIVAIFLLVFGGIYGGVFTVTEAAAVGALLTALAGLLVGQLKWAGCKRALLGTLQTTAAIFMIFVGADMLNAALALSQLPAELARWVGTLDAPPLAVIGAILVFYVLLGGVMDELSMLLLTLPVLLPTVLALPVHGLAPEALAIWFGILVLCVVNIGLIAPPVGLNVVVVNGFARDVPVAQTYRHVFIFLASDALRVLLLLAFPALTLWAVQFVGR
jgi:tripartite ATP-independent transporter DctM subunit